MERAVSSCSSADTLDSARAVKLLAALAQESRLAIYRLLVERGEEGMTVGKIGEALGISPTTLSFHLKELSHAGLLHSRQHGKYVIYAIHARPLYQLVDFLAQRCCGGTPCRD